jgi:hypothetical protein
MNAADASAFHFCSGYFLGFTDAVLSFVAIRQGHVLWTPPSASETRPDPPATEAFFEGVNPLGVIMAQYA